MLQNLVFLPALMTDARMYQPQIECLKDLPIKIHIFINKQYNDIEDFANNILQNVKGEMAVVGTSMGGYVAMEMFRQNPQQVKKLCLISTTYNQDNEQQKANRLAIIHQMEQIKDSEFKGINDTILAQFIYNITAEKKDLITSMLINLGRKIFITQQQMILSRSSYKVDFVNYSKSNLFIGAEHDSLTPAKVMEEMAIASNSKCLILKNCGHLSPIDQPLKVATLIKGWLSEK